MLALVLVAKKGVGERVFEAVWWVCGAILIGVLLGVVAGHAFRAATSRQKVSEGSVLMFTLVLALGVSALFYLALSHEEGAEDPVIWVAGTLVVAASTVVHAAAAMPLRRRYAALPVLRPE